MSSFVVFLFAIENSANLIREKLKHKYLLELKLTVSSRLIFQCKLAEYFSFQQTCFLRELDFFQMLIQASSTVYCGIISPLTVLKGFQSVQVSCHMVGRCSNSICNQKKTKHRIHVTKCCIELNPSSFLF